MEPESSKSLTLNELCSWLWEGANILRGPVEHADFKTYLFPLLFLKRINDVWEEEHQAAINEVGADFSENHRFNIPEGSRWNDIRLANRDIGQIIQMSMRTIESKNPDLSGIFGNVGWTNKERFRDGLLKDLIEHFSSMNIGNLSTDQDLVGKAYEWAIKKFADMENKSAGEFYTPRSVIKLMVEILQPDELHTIYDPACGTGGMLLQTLNFHKEKNRDVRVVSKNLYGQEKNITTSAMARCNLFLHGVEDFSIETGDTLKDPKFIESGQLKKFDLVIANPPFSLSKWGQETWKSDKWGRQSLGIPPKMNGDFAWIEHMIESTNDNGRIAIVLPEGALFRGGTEGKIREKILKSDLFEGIIKLAPNLFYGTPISACIIILNKNKAPSMEGKISIINSLNLRWVGKAQNILLDEHVDFILQTYHQKKELGNFSRVVGLDEVEKNSWNMNVSRYVLPANKNEIIGLTNSLEEFENVVNDVREIKREFSKSLQYIGLKL